VEHPCEKCGVSVEDGTPFCPGCEAPQIRVILPEHTAAQPAVTGLPVQTERSAAPLYTPVAGNKVQWRLALPGSAIAGFLLAMAMLVPFISPFLLMIFAGGLAAALYAHRSPLPIRAGQGARVGALGGLIGFVVLAMLTGLQIAIGGGRVVAELKRAMSDQIARNPDPRVQILMDKMAEPGGLTFILVVGGIVFLLAVLVCTGVGGAIAGAFLGKKRRNIG
jgi:hypothetical protein